MSIKAYHDDLHPNYTGACNNQLLQNFIKIYSSGKKLQAESALIPDYADCPELERIVEFIPTVDKAIPYRIDAYFPAGDSPWMEAKSE